MGVDLGELFTKEPCTFEDFAGRVIALDGYNVLHQFLSSIRQRDGTPLKDSQGRITSHLSGLLYRTANMVKVKIRPVYVFDGPPHPLKAKTIQQRRQRKEQAEQQWQEALAKGDLETARSKAQQTSRVTDNIINQSKQLLDALGVPYIQAPSEGEAQASYMAQTGEAFAVGSQDFDCLLFGAPLLVRNLTSSEKRKLPKKQAYTAVHPERISLIPGLEKLGISREQLIDIAILVGTDFNEGIKGYGPKKSLKLIKEKGRLEDALDELGNSEGHLTSHNIKALRDIFLKPPIVTDYALSWSPLDSSTVIHLLCDEHQFSRDRVEQVLENFSILTQSAKQKNLFDF
jgi:flap endonuclease-1